MAITTLDQLFASETQWLRFAKSVSTPGLGGRPTSLWTNGGLPAAGAAPAAVPGATLVGASTAGALGPWVNPGSGKETRISRLKLSVQNLSGKAILADRLWHAGSIAPTVTTPITINSPTLPARDIDGQTSGNGVFAALEIATTLAGTGSAASINYTNELGSTSRTAQLIDTPIAANAAVPQMYRFGLQAGDKGIQSIQSLTFATAQTSGAVNLVLYRPIVQVEEVTGVAKEWGPLSIGFPRIFDDSVLYWYMIPNSSTGGNIGGEITLAQG